jgi:spermidine/putrescine transport system permease protein
LKNNFIGSFGKFSIALTFLWLCFFAFLPFLLVFIASFLKRGSEDFLEFSFSLESYEKILNPIYLEVFLNSFELSLMTSIVTLILAFPFAYILSRLPQKLKAWALLLTIIPFWTSSLVRTYALVAILKTKGVLNGLLLYLGLIEKPLEIMYTGSAVIIGMVYTLLPFMILPLYASFEKLDFRLIEAARDLGANNFWILLKVILPLVMPGIVAGVILVFLPSLGMFFVPDLLGGAKDLIVGSFIRNQFLTFRDWPFGSVASVILTIFMLLLIFLYTKVQKRGGRVDENELL